MKKIKYLLMNEVNHGTEEEPNIVPTFVPKETDSGDDTFESNYAIALKEAYNGAVTVEEIHDPENEPSEVERLRADLDFLAIMTGVEL